MIKLASFKDVAQKEEEFVFVVARWLSRDLQQKVRQSPGWFWIPALGPSQRLLKDLKRGRISWEDYVPRYLTEMKEKRDVVERLKAFVKQQDVVLVCHCQDERRCHRFLLKEILEQ